MLSVIIPMYNEERVIGETVSRLAQFFCARDEEYELVLVDDGSTDGTRARCEALEGPCRVISYPGNRGKGHAMRRGAAEARGERLIFVDADLSYGTEIIGEALEAFGPMRADVVVGSRVLAQRADRNYPLARKLASGVFRVAVHAIARLPFTDTQCGFKCYTKAAAEAIFPRCEVDRFAIDIEILTVAQERGLRVVEIPAVIQTHAESSVSLISDSVQMLRDAFAIKKRHRRARG